MIITLKLGDLGFKFGFACASVIKENDSYKRCGKKTVTTLNGIPYCENCLKQLKKK